MPDIFGHECFFEKARERSCPMRTRKKGFTLIELLVVISIIALLMSVLLPSLKKAKEQAKLVVCKNNVRQIGFAVNFYMQDNHGKLMHPGFTRDWTFYHLEHDVMDLYIRYVDQPGPQYGMAQSGTYNSKIFYCPIDPPEDGVGYDCIWHHSSYAFTYQFMGQKLASPLESIYPDKRNDFYIIGQSLSRSPIYADGPPVIEYSRGVHSGKVNFLFGDFHIDSKNLSDYYKIYNYRIAQ